MDNAICLVCGGKSVRQYSWQSLYWKSATCHLCQRCQNKLQKLEEPCCRICARMLKDLSATFIEDGLCYDCVRWEKQGSSLQKNSSLYAYNDYMKELMALFKYRGDYAVVEMFADDVKQLLNGIGADYIVPIPLSEERLQERRFNQSEAIIEAAGFTPISLLNRTHSEKQSKKSRQDRMNQENIFRFTSEFSIKNKHIVIVDDIYTTGSTVHQAAEILQREGAKSVQSVTVAR